MLVLLPRFPLSKISLQLVPICNYHTLYNGEKTIPVFQIPHMKKCLTTFCLSIIFNLILGLNNLLKVQLNTMGWPLAPIAFINSQSCKKGNIKLPS